MVHGGDSILHPKSVRRCKHCRIAYNATNILLARTVGVREITDKSGSRKKFSGIICLHYLTKCLRDYDLNFYIKTFRVPKRTIRRGTRVN